jgi:toxin-antitoxin system PIN domain toxin
VIVPDVSLLVYAYNTEAKAHPVARAWWEDLLTRQQSVGMPWAVALGFVRLVTSPAVLDEPLAPLDAIGRVRTWIERPSVVIVDPGPRHLSIVEELFRATGVAGVLTTDTHLAALAIEHQATLCSNDSDFRRFPGLRWTNPLEKRSSSRGIFEGATAKASLPRR